MPRYSFFIIIILVAFSSALHSQENSNCGLLAKILTNEDIRKAFHLDLHKGKPIIFVDIKRLFKDCSFEKAYGREIRVVHDSSYLSIIDNSNIIINGLEKKRHKYRIELYHKIMEAYGHVEFSRRKKDYTISKVLIGNF